MGGSPSSPPRDHVCTGAPMSPFRISGMVPENGPTRLGVNRPSRASPKPWEGANYPWPRSIESTSGAQQTDLM